MSGCRQADLQPQLQWPARMCASWRRRQYLRPEGDRLTLRMMNMEQSSGELIERLRCLERRQAELQRANRRLGSVTGALLLMTGALVLMGPTVTRQPQILEAEQFVLRGSDGKVRGAMGTAPDGAVGLNLADIKGQTRITL